MTPPRPQSPPPRRPWQRRSVEAAVRSAAHAQPPRPCRGRCCLFLRRSFAHRRRSALGHRRASPGPDAPISAAGCRLAGAGAAAHGGCRDPARRPGERRHRRRSARGPPWGLGRIDGQRARDHAGPGRESRRGAGGWCSAGAVIENDAGRSPNRLVAQGSPDPHQHLAQDAGALSRPARARAEHRRGHRRRARAGANQRPARAVGGIARGNGEAHRVLGAVGCVLAEDHPGTPRVGLLRRVHRGQEAVRLELTNPATAWRSGVTTAGPMPSLWLVDGSHAIFRAYHALPHLSTRQGVPTNAVYGFTTMVIKALREGNPTHFAVAFDEEAKAKRSEIYAEYKATRGAPPDDLKPQFPLVRRVLEAMRIPAIGFAGYEADDVIATLARRARAQGWEVVIVTGDKDLMQLVDGNLRSYDSMYEKWYGPAEVEEKWGVPPGQVADLLALTGDKIDNIPGVPGVGEKTAASLLKEYGNLENVLANAASVKKPKLRENLLASVDKVRIGRRLIALYDDLPVPVQLEDLVRNDIDEPRARQLFTELEFVRLVKDLPRPPPTPPYGAPAPPAPFGPPRAGDAAGPGAAGGRPRARRETVRHPPPHHRGRAAARRA